MTPAMAPMMMAHTICTSCTLRPGCAGYGAELLRSMEARPRAWHSQNHIRQENRRAGSGYVSAHYRVEASVRRREPDTVGLASVPSCPDPAYPTSIGLAGLRHRAARLPPTTLLSRAGEARRHRAWHLIDQRDSCIQHVVSERTGEKVKLFVTGSPAQQSKTQGAGDDPFQQSAAGTAEEAGQFFHQRLLIDQRIAESVALNGLARRASARCSFDRMDSEPKTTSTSASRSARRNNISMLLEKVMAFNAA
jgi:hypothetical protein